MKKGIISILLISTILLLTSCDDLVDKPNNQPYEGTEFYLGFENNTIDSYEDIVTLANTFLVFKNDLSTNSSLELADEYTKEELQGAENRYYNVLNRVHHLEYLKYAIDEFQKCENYVEEEVCIVDSEDEPSLVVAMENEKLYMELLFEEDGSTKVQVFIASIVNEKVALEFLHYSSSYDEETDSMYEEYSYYNQLEDTTAEIVNADSNGYSSVFKLDFENNSSYGYNYMGDDFTFYFLPYNGYNCHLVFQDDIKRYDAVYDIWETESVQFNYELTPSSETYRVTNNLLYVDGWDKIVFTNTDYQFFNNDEPVVKLNNADLRISRYFDFAYELINEYDSLPTDYQLSLVEYGISQIQLTSSDINDIISYLDDNYSDIISDFGYTSVETAYEDIFNDIEFISRENIEE